MVEKGEREHAMMIDMRACITWYIVNQIILFLKCKRLDNDKLKYKCAILIHILLYFF